LAVLEFELGIAFAKLALYHLSHTPPSPVK
jgi:hypothetical protein